MIKTKLLSKLLLFLFLTTPFFVLSQNFTLDNDTSFLQVSGTSTLHDWHVQAEKQNGNIVFSDLNELKVESLTFSVESESLKSGKSSMDKKTYKALNTDNYKTISFTLSEVLSIHKKTANTFQINATGNLFITGVNKKVTLKITGTKQENLLILEGSHKILMTDYGIDPPKALLGTIKTGNEIEVKFKSVFTN